MNLFRLFRSDKKIASDVPRYEGNVHKKSIHHAVGWARDRSDPAISVFVEAVLPTDEGEKIVGKAKADRYYGPLSLQSYNDVRHGFQIIYDRPLSSDECEQIFLRPASATAFHLEQTVPPQRADAFGLNDGMTPVEGYINELSFTKFSGWMVDRHDKDRHPDFEAVILSRKGERIVGRGTANEPYPGLSDPHLRDGNHGFSMTFNPPLRRDERDALIVRSMDYGTMLPRAPAIQGYLDKLTLTNAKGWVRDRFRQEEQLEVEAVVTSEAGTRVIAWGKAGLSYAALRSDDFYDIEHGFDLDFPELSIEERDSLVIRPIGHNFQLPRAPHFQWHIDERSANHLAGWVRDRFRPEQALTIEAVLIREGNNRQVVTCVADSYHQGLSIGAPDDAIHGFNLVFDPPLSLAEQKAVVVRLVGADFTLN